MRLCLVKGACFPKSSASRHFNLDGAVSSLKIGFLKEETRSVPCVVDNFYVGIGVGRLGIQTPKHVSSLLVIVFLSVLLGDIFEGNVLGAF